MRARRGAPSRRGATRYADRHVQDARWSPRSRPSGRTSPASCTGPFQKHEGYLEGPEHVVTLGRRAPRPARRAGSVRRQIQELADGRPADRARALQARRPRRALAQADVGGHASQLGRDDVDEVVNACDAGREGELIFAYLYEQAKAKKPVKRLWLNSMTNAAMKERARVRCAPAEEFERLEEAARSRSEADWIVGMNATRAATIRLRSSFDGAVSLGRVQTPTLAIVARREEEIRAFKPEPYWLVDATFAAPNRSSAGGRRRARLPRAASTPPPGERAGAGPRISSRGAARSRSCARASGRAGDDHQAREERAARERADALRPDDAAARGQQPLRLLRPPHARRRAAPLRGAQGAHLPAHQLALPDRPTWSRRSSRSPSSWARTSEYAQAPST